MHYSQKPEEGDRPQKTEIKLLGATISVLRTEPESSVRAISALNHSAICSAHEFIF